MVHHEEHKRACSLPLIVNMVETSAKACYESCDYFVAQQDMLKGHDKVQTSMTTCRHHIH